MYTLLQQRLNRWLNANEDSSLRDGLIGLEKESLRVAEDGKISQLPHPKALGAALTHPSITTDYSEALLELITPPLGSAQQALQYLHDTHQYVYQHLQSELLWASSMPCIVTGEASIPIAQYGNSNPGIMKSIYRKGLAYRYGKMMQVIAGIHVNYSFSMDFWQRYLDFEQAGPPQQSRIDQHYFSMIRNIQRYGWLIAYLFGASPAVCRSFIDGLAVGLEEYDEYTYYQPYATSLRLGDIGYQNYKEGKTGVKANYDSLATYVQSLRRAMNTPYPEYEKIGVLVDGVYRQLNANVLQIENEYYSSVRPKQVTLTREEKAINALEQRGVQYVELRSLDLNVFEPIGINHSQLQFLEVFCLFCLLQQSPTINAEERREIDINQSTTAHRGREPNLCLHRDGRPIALKHWAAELCEHMQGVAQLLDRANNSNGYSQSLQQQISAIHDSELTPSASILRQMRENHESFHGFTMRKTQEHYQSFKHAGLSPAQQLALNQHYDRLAAESLQEQRDLEAQTQIPFAQYLANYYQDTQD